MNATLEKIRLKRKELGFTQEQVAEKLNISQSSYAKIEQGKTILNLPDLEKIAQVFGVELFDLIEPRNRSIYLNNSTADYANSGVHYHNHNNYYGNEGMVTEIEKLKLTIQHLEELLEKKEQENIFLKSLLEKLPNP